MGDDQADIVDLVLRELPFRGDLCSTQRWVVPAIAHIYGDRRRSGADHPAEFIVTGASPELCLA
jgi:hypothetical protein